MMVFIVTPMVSTSCVRKSRCTSPNGVNEASSSTPSTRFSNRIGSTTICAGVERLSPLSMVMNCGGTSSRTMCLPSAAACPTMPSPIPKRWRGPRSGRTP